MYCPRCAAQNLDDAKFCRSCGTGLETVALALSGKLPAATTDKNDPARQRRRAIHKLVRAGGLLGSSLLFGAALRLFSHEPDWIMVWMIFCGWMAVWGILSLLAGIQLLIESRDIEKDAGNTVRNTAELDRRDEFKQLPQHDYAQPVSITEHTTRTLVERPSSNERDQ